jgi:hypothetical protein
MTLKKIDTNSIVQGVARKNKKFRKYLEELKKKGKSVRKQPKLPGMKSGSGENGVVYSDEKGRRISKEEARKRFDKADAAERRERGMAKKKPYPPGMDNGGPAEISPLIRRRLMKEIRKPYRKKQTETKRRVAEPFRPTQRTGKRKKTPRPGGIPRPFNIGGLVDYYKDII